MPPITDREAKILRGEQLRHLCWEQKKLIILPYKANYSLQL